MRKYSKVIILLPMLVMALMLSSCRLQPIYNVKNAPVIKAVPGKKPVTENKVQRAITKAALGLGWQVRNVRPGLIYASIELRGHYAEVSIPYNRKSYSIMYKKSTNLLYNGTQIHRDYNGWVKNLNNAIHYNLSRGI